MSKFTRNILILSLVMVSILTTWLGFMYLKSLEDVKTGEKAVKLMYDFGSYDEVYQEHMTKLKELTTDDIYTNITVTNVDRALTTYLKFKGHSSKVKILQKTDSYIMYYLDTESITQTRKFVMYYHVNMWGKIDDIQECEVRDFYQANSSSSND